MEAKTKLVETSVRIPETWSARLVRIATRYALDGAGATRSAALRRCLEIGMDAMERGAVSGAATTVAPVQAVVRTLRASVTKSSVRNRTARP